MLKVRKSGVLLPLSCVNGDFAVGVMGEEAETFIDKIASAGFSYWQVLPLGMTDEKNSPYCSVSAFAGNFVYIDPRGLLKKGLATNSEVSENIYFGSPYTASWSFAFEKRLGLLKKAFSRLPKEYFAEIRSFEEKYDFIKPFSLFMAIKEKNGFSAWYDWEEKYKFYQSAKEFSDELSTEMRFWSFVQYEFFSQWYELKKYANEKGIKIIGDMPIYVSLDSVDVWSNPALFKLDQTTLKPKKVAGVPPDYFSKTGQKWGNPIYDWEKMKQTDYSWWVERVSFALEIYDTVRIDHFRAFASYWEVPQEAETAETGEWKEGVGFDFFEKLGEKIKSPSIIAEDLGTFGEDVTELLKKTGFPGMRVIEFGFEPFGDSTHLPHNYTRNCVAYVGTHDNNTLLGWLYEATESERRFALDYCGFDGENWGEGGYKSPSCRKIIQTLWRSSAAIALISVQDMCGFGSDARMNTPGVADGNWLYRVGSDTMNEIDFDYFEKINRLYKRYRN